MNDSTSSSSCDGDFPPMVGPVVLGAMVRHIASSSSSLLPSAISAIATTGVIPLPGGRHVLALPDLDDVVGMVLGMALQLLVGATFACAIYRTVLVDRPSSTSSPSSSPSSSSSSSSSGGGNCHRRDVCPASDGGEVPKCTTATENATTKSKATTAGAIVAIERLVVGCALAISAILSPYLIISMLHIENSASRFAMSASFVLYLFRTLESMYRDDVPRGATTSLGVYVAYFALPFDMSFDEGTNMPKMATWDDVRRDAMRLAYDASIIVFLCSLLSPFDYMPFGSYDVRRYAADADIASASWSTTMFGLFHWRHLADCLVIAYFFQQGLSLSYSAFGFLIQMTLGYQCPTAMRSPLLMASSPSDFWGRRWNVLVHASMKRGLYRPVRHCTNSSLVASLAVFVGSGAFHEWLVHACFVYGRDNDDDNRRRDGGTTGTVRIGSQTAFFVWNFVVITIERYVVSKNGTFARLFGKVPKSLVPPLIVMTSLPVAHWFRDPYMYGGFFRDYERCIPMIRRIDA
jgi:hypothetical protein